MTQDQKRAEIKRILGFLDEANRTVFKRMYSSLDQDRDINLVVDEMSWQHLDWAFCSYSLFGHECTPICGIILQLW